MDMELTYIYHSGFALSGDGFTVIMDYYRDSEDGQAQSDLNRLMDGTFSNQEAGMPEGIVHSELLRRPGKLYVLASHFHPDHFNKEVLQWREQRPDIIYIFSKDILRHRRAQKEDAVWLKKGEEYKDETLSVRAFGSTDVGASYTFLKDLSVFGRVNNLLNKQYYYEYGYPAEKLNVLAGLSLVF